MTALVLIVLVGIGVIAALVLLADANRLDAEVDR